MHLDVSEKQPVKWYFRTSILVITLLSVGPLALPLLWANPRYSRNQKLFWTIITVVLTIFLVKISYDTYQYFMSTYQEMIGNF